MKFIVITTFLLHISILFSYKPMSCKTDLNITKKGLHYTYFLDKFLDIFDKDIF